VQSRICWVEIRDDPKNDMQAIGLDVGLDVLSWLTGSENLHHGYWGGLGVIAGNVGAAQSACTDKLFALLADGPLRILDIGGQAKPHASWWRLGVT
jgi:hypothetical protein